MAVPKIKLLEARVALLEAELAKSQARVFLLEAQVKELLQRLEAGVDGSKAQPVEPRKGWGTFANDPGFDELVELGRQYRDSLRPREARKKPQTNIAAKRTKVPPRP